MGAVGTIIAETSKPILSYAERLLKDIGPHNAARKPTWGIGGEMIECNHATFVYGHLAIYPGRLYAILGKDAAALKIPASYEDLFAAGKPCKDDPTGSLYPPFHEIVPVFRRGMESAAGLIASLPDAEFTKPNTNERSKARFPTVGILANFLLNNHVAMHLGQVSTWRRAMGLPGADV